LGARLHPKVAARLKPSQWLRSSLVAIAHPSHHIDIQLVPSHLVERGLGGMSVRAWRSIITA
jgi:hypothetical protein